MKVTDFFFDGLFDIQQPTAIMEEVVLSFGRKEPVRAHIHYLIPDAETRRNVARFQNDMQDFNINGTYYEDGESNTKDPSFIQKLAEAEEKYGLKRNDTIDEKGVTVPAFQLHYEGFAKGSYNTCHCAHFSNGARIHYLENGINAYDLDKKGRVIDVYKLSEADGDYDVADPFRWWGCARKSGSFIKAYETETGISQKQSTPVTIFSPGFNMI